MFNSDFDPYEFMLKMNEDLEIIKRNMSIMINAHNQRADVVDEMARIIGNNTQLIWTLEERIKVLEEQIL